MVGDGGTHIVVQQVVWISTFKPQRSSQLTAVLALPCHKESVRREFVLSVEEEQGQEHERVCRMYTAQQPPAC
jgi:hypothetical protein